MQKRWFIKEQPSEKEIEDLSTALKIHPSLAGVLIQRGITSFEEAHTFFRPNLTELHNPFLMKDMDRAVERIQRALKKGEKILLFGDYDVDGTTAVALMFNVLTAYYKNVDFYIPDRYTEGYGVSDAGIDFARKNNFHLIISLDCGIRSTEKIIRAKEYGIDFIVCDHHLPGDQLPPCIVLDPKRSDCAYPYKELSGCGVAFKFLQALCESNQWDSHFLFSQLDLVAISIGADIVPVTGENRILCFHGLQQLNHQPRPGINEILKTAQKQLPLSLTNVVFIIAPRINAAGRIHTGRKAVELMVSNQPSELEKLAKDIHEDNEFRKKLDQEITEQALIQIAEDNEYPEKWVTVVYNENWHKGVVGIVASRLIEIHYRPTIVLTLSNGKITGSARSIKGLNIHDALEECTDLLEQFGGHAHAAGMTLPVENLPAFKQRFNQAVQKRLHKNDLVPLQTIDYSLYFSDIFESHELQNKIPKFKRIINQCEPHGPGNMKPVFLSTNVFVRNYAILKEAHLKMILFQPDIPVTIDAIAFNMADKAGYISEGSPVDILYTIESNTWRDLETLQLNIKDIRPSL